MTDWLYDYDRLPHTWAGAFYACFRALCILVGFLATVVVLAAVAFAMIGIQVQ